MTLPVGVDYWTSVLLPAGTGAPHTVNAGGLCSPTASSPTGCQVVPIGQRGPTVSAGAISVIGTLSGSYEMNIQVADLSSTKGSYYLITVDGTYVGSTPVVPVAGTVASVGTVSLILNDGTAPAAHTIGFTNGYFANTSSVIFPGGDFSLTISQTALGVPQTVTVAEIFASPNGGFVDLTSVANRRKFISDTGGAQNLGSDGSTPFGVTPPVFLSRTTTPASFATNIGRGGTFAVSGGTLSASSTNPPGSGSSTTSGVSFSPGQGVLGDYRNGNLYAFNPSTYLDNGSPRKWVRRWRGLAQGGFASVRFSYLAIDMETGAGTPDASIYALNPTGGMTFTGGSGYAVGDIIALFANDGATIIRSVLQITNVSAAGAVTGWVLSSAGNYTVQPTGFIQSSSSGAGTGFTLTITAPGQAYTIVGSPNPQLMLRWSDDGGHTWSNQRLKPVGRKGQTAFTVKFDRLGATSRFSGSDRIFELSSTDPFKVAIIDAEVEVS